MSEPYLIIEAPRPLPLQTLVNDKIKEGYEPIGGIAFIISPYGSDRYFQAVYKSPKTERSGILA